MATDHYIGNGLFYSGHVARHAFVTAAARIMVRVLFDAGNAVGAVRRIRTVALQAHHAGGFQQVRIVGCAMNIVATETGHAARIHYTVHKIVTLHSILVGGAIGEVRERCLTEFMILQLPMILEF